jgi:26S proteasome regulatory subunit N7
MEIEEKKDHAQELKELDDKIADAELNFGDIEVRDAILAKAHFVRRTLDDKDEAIKIYQLALKKTIEIGKKMDINFEILRIHLENRDIGTSRSYPDKVKDIIDDCKVLFEKGGDWERKNKLKVY